jgi:hypothetical protein
VDYFGEGEDGEYFWDEFANIFKYKIKIEKIN